MRLAALLMLVAAGCAPPPPIGDDTGAPDTDPVVDTDDTDTDTDTGDTDTGDTDTGDTDTDTDDTDVPPPGVALYAEGPHDCEALTDADVTGSAAVLRRQPVRVDGEPAREALSDGGRTLLDAGTLGGSSIQSEILAFEVLHRCDAAALLLTEGDIPYDDDNGKKTDLVVELDGRRIGVSVTRAVGFPPDDPYPVSRARDLLDDKLGDVLLSSDNVRDDAAWERQVLFIAAYADQHAEALDTAWAQVDPAVKADTLVVVSVTHGDDDFLYFNR